MSNKGSEVSIRSSGEFHSEENKINEIAQTTSSDEDALEKNVKQVTLQVDDYLYGSNINFEIADVGLGLYYYNTMTQYEDYDHHIDLTVGYTETKGQVLQRALRVAAKLKKLKVEKSDTIVICSKTIGDQIVTFLGIILYGAIVSPLDPNLSLDDYKRFFNKLKPKLAFCDPRTKGAVEKAIRDNKLPTQVVVYTYVNIVGNSFLNFCQKEKNEEVFKVDKVNDVKEKVALILPTGGNNGPAKLCCLSHYAVQYRSLVWKNVLFADAVRVLSWFPLNWFAQLNAVMVCFEMPVTFVLPSYFSERYACKIIYDLNVDRLIMSTPFAQKLSRHAARMDYNMSCLKSMIIGGTITTPIKIRDIWRGFHQARIYQSYGLTEAGLCSVHCINDAQSLKKKAYSSGRVICGVVIAVRDIKTKESLHPNELGEIFIHSEGMMTKYYNDPDLTKKSFTSDGLFKTQDVGSYDMFEHLYLQGRVQDIFYYDSIPYTCWEIDNSIMKHPGVEDVVTICKKTYLISLVLKVENSTVTETELFQFMQEDLPAHMIPKKIEFVSYFPISSVGKIKKYLLRKEYFGLTFEPSDD